MPLHFVNISRDDFLKTKLVYKFMPLENALKTLNERKLWFANPTTWQDPFEKRFIEAQFIEGGRKYSFSWKDRVYCMCVTVNAMSEAYWNTYSRNEIGVSFKIYKQQLLNALEEYDANTPGCEIFIGKVEYHKTNNITRPLRKIPFVEPQPEVVGSNEFNARLLLLKRVAFSYEDEIRIIIVLPDSSKKEGILLPYDNNNDFYKGIALDPKIEANTYNMLKCTFEGYGFVPYFNADGKLVTRIEQSHLYKTSNSTTIKV